jgi:hypothetical protein
MKVPILALLVCLGAAWAQTPPPAAGGQAERLRRMASEAAAGQTATAGPKLPDLPDDAVIAVFESGARFTMADFKRLVAILPPQNQQMAAINPKGVVQWWAGMLRLAEQGEAAKLDQTSPSKEMLAYNRTLVLGQALMNYKLNAVQVGPEDVAKYYADNKERYKQVRVKALYIAFGDSAAGGKQSRTEAQAADAAAGLLAQIRSGADFVKLVKGNSDDAASREKDGDFATFHKKDNIPDALAAAVFALKQGEVSEPIRQPNGYYLLRAEEVSYVPMDQLQTEIVMAVSGRLYNEWLTQNTGAVKVEFPNPAFAGAGAPAPAGK